MKPIIPIGKMPITVRLFFCVSRMTCLIHSGTADSLLFCLATSYLGSLASHPPQIKSGKTSLGFMCWSLFCIPGLIARPNLGRNKVSRYSEFFGRLQNGVYAIIRLRLGLQSLQFSYMEFFNERETTFNYI